MRVAVVADIGQPVYHVGDEAIGHAVREELRSRGVRPLMLTRDVRHTHTHFGPVDAARGLVAPWEAPDREHYLAQVREVLAGRSDALPADDQVFRFVETLRDVDAVLIGGGGNMNSPYGWLLHERLLTMLVARSLGKPVVLTGQTLGPTLTDHDVDALAEALAGTALASLREHHSVALARRLAPGHPAIVGGLDDAAAWRLRTPAPAASDVPRVVATFAPGCGDLDPSEAAHRLAALLDGFAGRTGARIELLPHMALPGSRDRDLGFHAEVAAASTSGRVVALPLPTAEQAADAVVGADLVVTSRYHPVVFAATRGVPVLALVPDRYSDVRMDGALTHHGLGGWTVPLGAITADAAAGALDAVWDERERVADHLRAHLAPLLEQHAQRWDAIVAALSGRPVTPEPWRAAPTLAPPAAVVAARALSPDPAGS